MKKLLLVLVLVLVCSTSYGFMMMGKGYKASSSSTTTLLPNSDVTSDWSAFTFDPTTTSGYTNVSDSSDSSNINTAADYVSAVFGLPNSTCTSVTKVTVYVRAASSSGTPSFRFRLHGSTDTTDVAVSTTITTYSKEYLLDPDDGLAWTCTDVDAMDAGAQTRVLSGVIFYIYDVWVIYE